MRITLFQLKRIISESLEDEQEISDDDIKTVIQSCSSIKPYEIEGITNALIDSFTRNQEEIIEALDIDPDRFSSMLSTIGVIASAASDMTQRRWRVPERMIASISSRIISRVADERTASQDARNLQRRIMSRTGQTSAISERILSQLRSAFSSLRKGQMSKSVDISGIVNGLMDATESFREAASRIPSEEIGTVRSLLDAGSGFRRLDGLDNDTVQSVYRLVTSGVEGVIQAGHLLGSMDMSQGVVSESTEIQTRSLSSILRPMLIVLDTLHKRRAVQVVEDNPDIGHFVSNVVESNGDPDQIRELEGEIELICGQIQPAVPDSMMTMLRRAMLNLLNYSDPNCSEVRDPPEGGWDQILDRFFDKEDDGIRTDIDWNLVPTLLESAGVSADGKKHSAIITMMYHTLIRLREMLESEGQIVDSNELEPWVFIDDLFTAESQIQGAT